MNFDDLDAKLRVFETANDLSVLPGIYIVARIDGRSFTRLTKELLTLDAPFDDRFRDAMVATVEHLMGCGFRVVFGYTQSDEISLLFHRDDALFDRKLRKLISVLAGEASACFSLRLGVAACFDTRICQLPNAELVVEYFRWRQEDATRNALNGHCYWALRREGRNAQQATAELNALSVAEKNELLFQRGINFNDLPKWQRRGIGFYWEEFEKAGTNPLTGETRTALRRRIRVDMELPMREEYDAFLRGMVAVASA